MQIHIRIRVYIHIYTHIYIHVYTYSMAADLPRAPLAHQLD